MRPEHLKRIDTTPLLEPKPEKDAKPGKRTSFARFASTSSTACRARFSASLCRSSSSFALVCSAVRGTYCVRDERWRGECEGERVQAVARREGGRGRGECEGRGEREEISTLTQSHNDESSEKKRKEKKKTEKPINDRRPQPQPTRAPGGSPPPYSPQTPSDPISRRGS